MRLVEVEDEPEEPELKSVPVEKSWLEWISRKKEKALEENSRVYFKNVRTYEDCKLVIDNYKTGAVCIYSLESTANPDAQGMMNYICGGLYALDGEVCIVGSNIFMTIIRKQDMP